MPALVARIGAAHKRAVKPLFDRHARQLRRHRAAGRSSIILDRAFDESIDRLAAVRHRHDRLLLVGALDPRWTAALAPLYSEIVHADSSIDALPAGSADACLAIGGLDTLDDLPGALASIRRGLRPDAPLLGALVGGDSLPALRSAMLAADQATGAASPRVHPRIDPPTLAALLQAAGFAMPVVDVDRITLRYSSLDRLVADLRDMAGTNLLADRPRRSRGQRWLGEARNAFAALGAGGRSEERLDLIHFLAWSPPI